MSRRMRNIVFAVTALLLGGALYVLFRGNTCVSILVRSILPVPQFPMSCPFLSFYLPDFLWAFSLCCLLMAIHTPDSKGVVLCSVFGFSLGVLWELLQYAHITGGTGDIWDMAVYLLAAALSVLINLGGKKT